MAINKNQMSVVGLIGMILTASFMVHGPMIIPAFTPKKTDEFKEYEIRKIAGRHVHKNNETKKAE